METARFKSLPANYYSGELNTYDELNIIEVKKSSNNSNLPFTFSVSLAFLSEGALSYKWHRQCDIFLFETLQAKNSILSNWLDNILNYRTKDNIKFDLGNMPRVLTGDFKEVIARSHDIYLQDENLHRMIDFVEHTYEKFEKDKIKVLVNFKTTLRNTNPEEIKQIIFNYDEDILDVEVKKAVEDNNEIEQKRIWQSPIPEKDYEKSEYKERFVMSIPFTKHLHYDENKDIKYVLEITLPIKTLDKKDYIDGFYNWRRYDTKEGTLRINWDKELFDARFCGSLFLDNCTYEDFEFIQLRENLGKLINAWKNRPVRSKEVERLENQLNEKHRGYKCKIYPVEPNEDAERKHYYFEKKFENLEKRHLAVFYWIPYEVK